MAREALGKTSGKTVMEVGREEVLADLGTRQTFCTLKSNASPEGEIVGDDSGKRFFFYPCPRTRSLISERGEGTERERSVHVREKRPWAALVPAPMRTKPAHRPAGRTPTSRAAPAKAGRDLSSFKTLGLCVSVSAS